jgi:DNA adenine methylase
MRSALLQTSRPLLKWAGGKRQLLDRLSAHYPADFDRYVEPFFGSGAVFFDLHAGGLLDGRTRVARRREPDLVGCYRTVRDNTDAVIAALTRLQSAHRTGGEAFYYEVRDRRFNPVRATLLREPAPTAARGYTPALAAMLIFLNRTGFNGLFRLNRDGGFNVPAGRYVEPRICDPVTCARSRPRSRPSASPWTASRSTKCSRGPVPATSSIATRRTRP